MSRPAAQDRLARLLAVVPWVAARDGPAIAEVCERFEVTEQDLLDDLDLLFLCGVYPFTPDSLIEVDVADGRVWIRFADYFRRPLRLTAPEGLALLGAGSALLSMPGADADGALARALDKLASVLGVDPDDSVAVELEPATPEVLDRLRRATAEHRQLEIDYYSFGRDSSGTRLVEPWEVFNARGQWYLSGFCRAAGGERLFRVDRISAATMLDESFAAPPGPRDRRTFHPDASSQTIVLDLAPPARWIAEQYPNLGVVEGPDGVLRVTLPVTERAWFERLLLRAGPSATVVDGDQTVGPAAAGRILARYRVPKPVQ
ncbi:MAG: proteasome accessory factor [Acidimicrobiaceae bacterium]|nr:proteasome accessory factor [Acidimicrobiaceae bacterium]